MGSLGNPKTWVPYLNPKDCTQGFCSWNCPQWCKSVFPPPPPSFVFPNDNSGLNLSPLVISIIGILASAFLLVSYYAIVRKYCGKRESSSRRENHEPDEESDENHDHDLSFQMPWHVATSGLDEVLIKSIAVCKYKKGDGLVEGTECSVCLSEFQDDESLRLLPKCSHAFHLSCIDTWLTSHSNCPLCRANIVSINASPPVQLSNPVAERAQDHESNSSEGQENVIDIEHQEKDDGQEENQNQAGTIITRKSGLRALSDVGNLERRDTVIEIPEEGDHQQHIRRSVSMDYSRQSQFSVADILQMNQEEDIETENVGSSKVSIGETSKSCHGNRVLVYVTNPVTMKRSFSSGKFFFRRHGRGRDQIISI